MPDTTVTVTAGMPTTVTVTGGVADVTVDVQRGIPGLNNITTATTTNLTGFISGNGATVTASTSATFVDGSEAIFDDGSQAIFDDGSQAFFDVGSQAFFVDGSQAFFDAGSQAFFVGGSLANFSTGSQANFESGSSASFESGSEAIFDSGSEAIFESGCTASFDNGTIKLAGTLFTSSLNFAAPTSAKTITLPDATGTVALLDPSSGTQSFTGQVLITGQNADSANSAMTRGLGDARYGARVQFVMTADATITSATHANVAGATVDLEASSNYSFEGFIHVEALAALSRIQCKFAYTGTLQTVQGAINCPQTNGSTFPIVTGAFLTTSFADVSSLDRALYIAGLIRTNAAGTLTMTATRVSGSGSPLIKAGTQIRFTKL